MPDNQHVPDNFGTNYGITYTGNLVTYMQRVRNANADNRAFNQTKNMMERRAISGGGMDFSLARMYAHFQIGGGNPMTIKMSSVDFGGATQKTLGLTGMTPGDKRGVDLFNAGATNPAALAFGRVNMMYHGNNQFSIISDKSSRFDFNPIIDPNASWGRNAGNVLGTLINYNLFPGTPLSPLVPLFFGGPYDVNFRGTIYIPR